MKTIEYLAAVKARKNLKTDYQVAKALGVPTSLMSRYTQGKSVPGPLTAFKIAEILGDQPAAVIADLEAERAEKMGKADEADAWKGILKRLAIILLAVGGGGFLNGGAGLAQPGTVDPLHIVPSTKKKKPRRWNDGLGARFALA